MKGGGKFALALLSGVLFLGGVAFAEESTAYPLGDWYSDITVIPERYKDVLNVVRLAGDAEKEQGDRGDVVKLSSDAKDSVNSGQIWGVQKIDLTKPFELQCYIALDPTTWGNSTELLLMDAKELNLSNGATSVDNSQKIKQALSFIVGKSADGVAHSGMFTDLAVYDNSGVKVAMDLVNDVARPTISYMEPENNLRSNSVYYQDKYNLYLPSELRGYEKGFFTEEMIDVDGSHVQTEVPIVKLYNSKMKGLASVGDSLGYFRRLHVKYTPNNDGGVFLFHYYGYTPSKVKWTKKEINEYLGGEEIVLGFNSKSPNKQDANGKKVGRVGNKMVISDLSPYYPSQEAKILEERKISNQDGFLVRAPKGYDLRVDALGFQKKEDTQELSFYMPNLSGTVVRLTDCDKTGVPRTYDGKRLYTIESTGTTIPVEDIGNYNRIPEYTNNHYILLPDGRLKTDGKEQSAIKNTRYKTINFHSLYLDINRNTNDFNKITKKENVEYPIKTGYYLLEVIQVGEGFSDNATTWLVHINQNEQTKEIETRIYKREKETDDFQLYNQNIVKLSNAPIQKERGEEPFLALASDARTIDLGYVATLLSEEKVNVYVQMVDEDKFEALSGESAWAFYRKVKTQDKEQWRYSFTGSKDTIEQWGFGAEDVPISSNVLSIKDGLVHVVCEKDSTAIDGESVYVLRQLQASSGLQAIKGYYIIRFVNGNEKMIPRKDYLLGLYVYQHTQGEHEDKMNAVRELDPDYSFSNNEHLITNNVVKESLVDFLDKFGDTYGEEYENLPDIYRVGYQAEVTYYPDGTQPNDIETAAVDSSKFKTTTKDFDHVIPFSFNAAITRNALGNPKFANKEWSFGTSSEVVSDVTTSASKHELYFNLVQYENGGSGAKVPNTSRDENLSVMVLIAAGSIFLMAIGTVVYLLITMNHPPKREE
ncbi:hypothetical protein SAMN02745116_00160 [Pilibacter termitis]|uniref:Uncharacterized protein n=1 Tax=Pilibacter termitis TaxID=263852 RepID=A0A1T4KB11_9ENTE|nr:hypothetical protein [Pilibacter termitis]SJZ39576.1 hypothetical protein SAMN02745116_00160 [Pilibacter termitis]